MGPYPDQLKEGRYPNQLEEGQYPDRLKEGQYPDQSSEGQYPDQINSIEIRSRVHTGTGINGTLEQALRFFTPGNRGTKP